MAHLLWAILHVEYDGDGLLSIPVHLGESRYQFRSRSGQEKKNQILTILISDAVARNPIVPFVFLYVCYNSQNRVLLYDVTIRRNVLERKLAFGVKKICI